MKYFLFWYDLQSSVKPALIFNKKIERFCKKEKEYPGQESFVSESKISTSNSGTYIFSFYPHNSPKVLNDLCAVSQILGCKGLFALQCPPRLPLAQSRMPAPSVSAYQQRNWAERRRITSALPLNKII